MALWIDGQVYRLDWWAMGLGADDGVGVMTEATLC